MVSPQGDTGKTPGSRFAKTLSAYHQKYAEAGPSSAAQLDTPIRYDVVLDEDKGMISSLMGGLEVYLEANMSSANGDGTFSPQVFEALKLEHRTWALIRAVYGNRLQREDPSFAVTPAAQQLKESPYTTPLDLVQTIVNEESDLSLWATLVTHLQSRPLFPNPPPIEARHGYLPSTVRKAKNAQLAGAGSNGSLDPDFTLRDPHGPGLAGEDQTYQGPLLEKLWDLVRHGELDEAITVCNEGGEPWRAASLVGGSRWYLGGLTKDSMEMTPLDGNRHRALWKKSARAIASNPTLSSAERQLYAALVSDLQALLPACNSWEDQLWAHVQHRLEARIDRRWHELGGFWETEDQLLGRDEEAPIELGRGGLEEVFASISAVQTGEVAEQAHNPYYVAQKLIILGRADSLLDTFADKLAGIEETVSQDLIGPLVRFFAHLVLVLRSLSQPVPEAAANAILEAYLRVLESEGNDSLVAMYAACLREGNGEESYARFLRAMDPAAKREVKQEALLRAKQYNLDVAVIARETVRMILEEAFQTIPSLSPGQPDITSFTSSLTERDVHLIRAIEWLTMVPETLPEALARSNDVARYFLALGQANAANALLKTLPSELETQPDDEEQQLDEHLDYRKLFDVFDAHERIEDVYARKPVETATKSEHAKWQKQLDATITIALEETKSVLVSDWLRFDLPSSDAYISRRRKELQRIRQIFIPDLVMRIHARLVDSRRPIFLQAALDLTVTVAAEDHHVYEEFLGHDARPFRLTAYLERVREAGMLALRGGSGSAFVVAQ